MRIKDPGNPPSAGNRTGSARAFTLPEVMIASSVMLLVVGGILAGNSFGMRMLSIVQPKLVAHEKARTLITLLSSDIGQAKYVRVGNGDAVSFNVIPDDSQKQGNAIQIYPSNDTNDFIRYFHDSGDNTLKRMTNDPASAVPVANAVDNDQVFTAEDYQGGPLTNEQPRVIVGVVLNYSELEGSGTPVGTNNYFTAYVLNIKVAAGSR